MHIKEFWILSIFLLSIEGKLKTPSLEEKDTNVGLTLCTAPFC